MLYAFGAAVAFQPPNTPAPAGYKADVGLPYGPRTNGLTYGWVGGPNVTAVDRNAAKSPDARSDVFAVLRPTGGGSVWEIAVPNGSYQVRVSAGDATTTNESYKIDAEGVRVVAGKQTAAARWVSGTKTVAVADGKLTVAAAPDTTAKINYILISQQVNGSGPAAGGLTLVNAATDADIGPLVAGQTINLAQTGTQLSVRANPTPAEVGSVKFVLDGGASIRVDNTSAYALAGNAGGDYYAMTPTVGPHTLAVTAYGGADATGPAGATKTVKFTVVASAGTSPPVVPPTIPPTVPPVVPPKVPPVVPPAVPPVVPPAVPPVVPPTVPPVVPPVVPPTVPPAGPVAHDAALDAKLASVLSFAGQQLQATYSDLKSSPGRYPRVTNAGGKWATTNVTEWTVGFYPGELWQMYYQTGDTAWRDKAVQYAAPTKVNGSLVEDVEFRSFLPLAPLYKATGDTKYRDALLQSAASKDSQYSATVGGFNTSWNKSHSGNPRANFGLLMDQLMDMELMFWAAKQPGGKASYRAHAIAHAETTMKYLIRPDGGSYHWGFFDRDTGDFVSGETAQGYQDSSTWARGQAWGI
ncbi:MAG: glycosyl hydrolase family 88, partial [Phycisphaerales bacterium]|nr:glycosyl hydrolase family 88 [Phycisphaerales bacterium]